VEIDQAGQSMMRIKREAMATTSQIISDLEFLGATPKIVGYFTALTTLGFITLPLAWASDPTRIVPVIPPVDRTTRTRGMSKVALAIAAVFTAEGMPKRDIVKATGLTAKQVETALKTMLKNNYATMKNGRYFAGPALSTTGTAAAAAPLTPRKAKASGAPSIGTRAQGYIQAHPNCTYTDLIQGPLKGDRKNHVGIALARFVRSGDIATAQGPYVWLTKQQQIAA
jgi:hypothetical protein